MQFLIADTFTDSLTRLQADEQKAVKTTAFDLQTNPAHPSLKFHRLDKAKDKDFWSVRSGRDIRLIVHKTESALALVYVDHHDKAYAWAERRKLERHPKTGAAQLVEIRETVQEIVVPKYVEVEAPAPVQPPLFADRDEDELLGYGVPPEWVDDVRQANEEKLLELVDHLPEEAAQALLELATGGTPVVAMAAPAEADPFEHPDAQRRFRVVQDVEELERALDFPWERWMVFLHPAQREIVDRDFGGPARVSGSAGTGKTIVAVHRASCSRPTPTRWRLHSGTCSTCSSGTSRGLGSESRCTRSRLSAVGSTRRRRESRRSRHGRSSRASCARHRTLQSRIGSSSTSS
jgi:mRNA-degrading endonuclease RelE of RelBE toxin-antitoxin system